MFSSFLKKHKTLKIYVLRDGEERYLMFPREDSAFCALSKWKKNKQKNIFR